MADEKAVVKDNGGLDGRVTVLEGRVDNLEVLVVEHGELHGKESVMDVLAPKWETRKQKTKKEKSK